MRLQWVIAVCVCWLALLVQPQQCMEFTKETTEMGLINKLPDNYNFASSLLSVVSPMATLALKQQQEKKRIYGDNLIESEPKVYITGFNGLCVSIKDNDYRNGNAIVLNECKEGQENQLWSLESSDQTIRSKGKCLTTDGYKRGDNVMIYDCRSAVQDATKWEIHSDSRKIINPKSGLSLTAVRDSNTSVYYLRVGYYNYVPRQAWLPTSYTKPPVSKIVGGFGTLCLTLEGVQTVQLAKCGHSIEDEMWVLYPDGTIRPEQHQERCLRYEYGRYVVSVGTCGGWTNEGWVLKDDWRVILHLSTGMVMDIKETPGSPGHFSLYLNCYDGRVSQVGSMKM